MKTIIFFLLFFSFSHLFSLEKYCIFTPPSNWTSVLPEKHSEYVKIGFLKKSKKTFKPSINLAVEKTETTLEEYIKAVKEIHQSQSNSIIKDLGFIKTKSEKAYLLEIRTKTSFEDIIMLQLITATDGHVFVLTGASSKDEYLTVYQEFLEAFNSLNISNNIFSLIENEKIQRTLQEKYDLCLKSSINGSKKIEKEEIKKLHKFIEKNLPGINPYFQIELFQKLSTDIKEKAKDKL